MGLYDTLIIGEDVELPEWPFDEHIIWQTKDIGVPHMGTYKIENGRLFQKEVERESRGEVITSKCPFPKSEILNEQWIDMEHHGSFEFHGGHPKHVVEHDDLPDTHESEQWWSYEARFTDGELENIILLEHRDLGD